MSKKTFKKWALVNKETGELATQFYYESRAAARDDKADNEKVVRCTIKID